MPALHSPQTVLSLRHMPSWLLLALSAGCVNAIAFLACARFVTHVTGTVTLMGMDSRSTLLALDYFLVFACFVIGAMTSARWIEVRYYKKKRPLYPVPLLVVAAILFTLALCGVHDKFGKFGGSIEGQRDFIFLAVIAFAMGLQNAAVATSTGLVVRTTHLTGAATDLGVYLATAVNGAIDADVRRLATRHAGLRAGKIAAFACGAALGADLSSRVQYGALFVPAGIVLGVTMFSFVPDTLRLMLPSKRDPHVRAVLRRDRAEGRRPTHFDPQPHERQKWLEQIREQPVIAPTAYVHPAATLIGRIVLGEGAHVAADTSIRADEGTPFHIGEDTNVQDGVVLHALKNKYVVVGDEEWAIYVGSNVSIAHDALVHGPCYVGDHTFVGFKAVVHDAVVGANCFVGIGAVVVGVEIPDGRFIPHGRIVDTPEAVAALPPVAAAHEHFNADVVEVNRGLAAAYHARDRELSLTEQIVLPAPEPPAEPPAWDARWSRSPSTKAF